MEKEEFKNDPLFNLFEIMKTRKIKMIIGFLIVLAMTVAGVLVMPSVYETSAKVGLSLPVVPRGAELVPYLEELRDIKSFVASQPVMASSRLIYEKAVIALNLHKIERSPSFFGKLKGLFFKEKKKDPLAEAMDELYRITDVRGVRGTNIIQFSARSGSSEGAAQVANTLAKAYIDYENGLMASRSEMAYDIIYGELENARKSLDSSQRALNGLKRNMNVFDDPAFMKQKVAEYSIQYEQLQETIKRLESQPAPPKQPVEVKKMKPERTRQAQPAESPKVRELRTNLKVLKNELDASMGRYTEKHPTVIKLKKKVAALEEELLQEVKNSPAESPQPVIEAELDTSSESAVVAVPDINELKIKRDSLSKRIQTLESKLSRASFIGVDVERLNRDANQKELEYLAVKDKLDRARIMRDQAREGPIKIIDPATPPLHASMKKKIILLIVGLIASVIFGIAVGFIAEYYEDVFKSPEEVEKSLNLPVLATIPRIPQMASRGKSRTKPRSNEDQRLQARA